MKSLVLCEGHDDLWFIGYYLHKTRSWNKCQDVDDVWVNYKIPLLNQKQTVEYYENKKDTVAVWNVGGKDRLGSSLKMIFNRVIPNFAFDPIECVVIVRDRDDEEIEEILAEIGSGLPSGIQLNNKEKTVYTTKSDGTDVSCSILPIIIPFEDAGAIETILIDSVRESGADGPRIVDGANFYINSLLNPPLQSHLKHQRDKLKAKYSAVVAVVNPTHSNRTFQDMVMGCPWEKSDTVRKHFEIIADAISSA